MKTNICKANNYKEKEEDLFYYFVLTLAYSFSLKGEVSQGIMLLNSNWTGLYSASGKGTRNVRVQMSLIYCM